MQRDMGLCGSCSRVPLTARMAHGTGAHVAISRHTAMELQPLSRLWFGLLAHVAFNPEAHVGLAHKALGRLTACVPSPPVRQRRATRVSATSSVNPPKGVGG